MLHCADLINPSHPLSPDDVPNDLTAPCIPFDAPDGDPKRLLSRPAALAAERLFAAACADGLSLWGVSGYRPYARQKELYEAHLQKTGPAHRVSGLLQVAPPGCSEHQSGLALDVSCPAVSLKLTEAFAATPEGRWLCRHAPLYGFILRYPRGKEEVTGYPWEPWHIRYVSRPLALYLSMTGQTLEDYRTVQAAH